MSTLVSIVRELSDNSNTKASEEASEVAFTFADDIRFFKFLTLCHESF